LAPGPQILPAEAKGQKWLGRFPHKAWHFFMFMRYGEILYVSYATNLRFKAESMLSSHAPKFKKLSQKPPTWKVKY